MILNMFIMFKSFCDAAAKYMHKFISYIYQILDMEAYEEEWITIKAAKLKVTRFNCSLC